MNSPESEEVMEKYDKKPEKTIEDYIRDIQAQQQEIDRLKELLADWKYNTKCDADHIAALTADKDEQAGRLMKMDYLLRRTLPILAVTNDQQGLIEQINELLGGKEDA